MKIAKIVLAIAAALLIAFIQQNAHAQTRLSTDSTIVSAEANIFGAGKATPPSPGGGGNGVLPTECLIPSGSEVRVITFPSITGRVSCCNGGSIFNGPDGGPHASGNTDILSFQGISGIKHNGATMFLVGVFLDDSIPGDPAPQRMDFTTGTNFEELSPALNQTFFIGDGLTGSGTGILQRFIAPAGATRLFLGFADALGFDGLPGAYADNVGELFITSSVVTSIDYTFQEILRSFTLHPNYPNPFNPSTQITFALPSAQKVTLKVFDLTGKEVATLLQNEQKPAGTHELTFEAQNLPSGVYFYRLHAGEFAETKKMLLVR